MKASSILLASWLVLSSCKDNASSSARLEEKELEIAALKTQIADQGKQLQAEQDHRVATAFTINELQQKFREVQDDLEAYKTRTDAANAKAIAALKKPSRQVDIARPPQVFGVDPEPRVAAGDPLEGVPADVATIIRHCAFRQYPADAEMYAYVVKQEIEGWRKMSEYQRSPCGNVSATDKALIIAFAIHEYSADFSMQAYTFETQAKAWEKLYTYQNGIYGSVPAADKQALLAAAKAQYPRDFSMQAYTFETEAEAFQKIMMWERGGTYRKPVIDAAKEKWPHQWGMVVYEVEKGSGR